MSSLWDTLGIPSTQIPISLTTFLSHVVPLVVSYTIMAVLAITPRTHTFRIALWPILTLLALRAAFIDWSSGKPELIFVNGELVRFIMCIPPHAFSWISARKPLVRHLPVNSSASIIMDAFDLVMNLRGVGWNWSHGLYIPPETRPRNRMVFGCYALVSVTARIMIATGVTQIIHMFTADSGPNPQSLTIFDESLPLFVRYFRSSIITVLAGYTAYNGLQGTYHLFTAIGTLLLGQDPAQWPPGLEDPWYATSLTEFWGRRWQQWFRHTFIVCAYPFYAVFGHTGKIVGAFLTSVLAHHLILITYDRHSEMWRMFVGFGMMVPGMLVERAFYKVTGKRVGGLLGWVWMVSWLVTWYSFVVEGFIKVGMYSLPSESQAWGWVENSVKAFDTWLHTI